MGQLVSRSVLQRLFKSPERFPESVSVHSQSYDKRRRNSDEYVQMEMNVTLSNRPNRLSYFEQ